MPPGGPNGQRATWAGAWGWMVPTFSEKKDAAMEFIKFITDTGGRLAIPAAAELSAAPGAGGKPIHEWLEVRPFYGAPSGTGD